LLKQNLISRSKTFLLNELDFPDLKSFSENGKRFYETPTGEKYPSVTTVLGSRDKKWLYEWRARVGEKEANAISTKASNRGTQLHTICEKYIRNEDDFAGNKPFNVIEMFKSIQKYVDKIEEVYGNEIAVYSHDLKTAGRIDVFCKMGGKPVILDFKTSSRLKEEKTIENYFLQATTYAMMIRELKGIEVPKLVILIAVENELPQLFIKNTKDYEDQVKQVFNEYHLKNA